MSDHIRVAIRMRPLLPREIEEECPICWIQKDSKTISQNQPASSSCREYHFDRVFDGDDSNVNVYLELCQPIVHSVMQGFNGTIFAYGQTSSGKTFTMMGDEKQDILGVIQYTISDIFDQINRMAEREFLLRVSFLEIYNEKVMDLLSNETKDLKIQAAKGGFIKIIELQETIVQDADQVLKLMMKGKKKQHTADNSMNWKSSRSHSIFCMIIESRMRGEEDAAVNVSVLNLVDLAGSEKPGEIGATGERFIEGTLINKSLSELSRVINQLSEGQYQYINYRNSKLTRILQNSLGGNTLTAIICTVTPASLGETRLTLQFASRAKNIKNKPQMNEIVTDQALLRRYANEIKKLSEELEASKEQGKELEEKTKQNEILKKQIQDLKSKFVSQIVPEKKCKMARRETWGGTLDAVRLECPLSPFISLRMHDLSKLGEESESDLEGTPSSRETLKELKNTGTETEVNSSFSEKSYTFSEDKVKSLESLILKLQNDLAELQEFTTLERQVMVAEAECSKHLKKPELEKPQEGDCEGIRNDILLNGVKELKKSGKQGVVKDVKETLEDPVYLGPACGPAVAEKTIMFERIVYRQDKEISKLKEQLGELKLEIAKLKKGREKEEVKIKHKSELGSNKDLVTFEDKENKTVYSSSRPFQKGAIPKVRPRK